MSFDYVSPKEKKTCFEDFFRIKTQVHCNIPQLSYNPIPVRHVNGKVSFWLFFFLYPNGMYTQSYLPGCNLK